MNKSVKTLIGAGFIFSLRIVNSAQAEECLEKHKYENIKRDFEGIYTSYHNVCLKQRMN